MERKNELYSVNMNIKLQIVMIYEILVEFSY